jgi:3-hydroxyisobutyrate dehydrogenase-like beta-hydroxyacid dehydrogenase
VVSVLTSDISKQVCLGDDGVITSGNRGLLVLDSTTGRPDDAVQIAKGLEVGGIEYADMTLSGNAALAARGELVAMFGGTTGAYERAVPIMEAIGRSHHLVGPVGAGAQMKLIVNHVLVIHRFALAEGLVSAERAGLDLGKTLEILRDGAAYSKAMDLWGDRMATGDHGHPDSRLRQSHKDSMLITEQGEALGTPLEFIDLARRLMAEGEASGLGDLDNSAVIEVLRRQAGIGRVDQPDP